MQEERAHCMNLHKHASQTWTNALSDNWLTRQKWERFSKVFSPFRRWLPRVKHPDHIRAEETVTVLKQDCLSQAAASQKDMGHRFPWAFHIIF